MFEIHINCCSANTILVKGDDFVSVLFLVKTNVYKAMETVRMVR